MYPRIFWLRKERAVLGTLLGLETYLSIKVILMEVLDRYWRTLDSAAQDLMFQTNGFFKILRNRILFTLTSEPNQEFTIFMIYLPLCLLLAVGMILCIHANYKIPVMSRWGVSVFFLGIILPLLIGFLYAVVGSINRDLGYRPEVEAFWHGWLYLGILPANVCLYRDLHRYTKAIRAQKKEDALMETDKERI